MQKKRIKKLFGDDWTKVHRAILELWAKLVLMIKRKDSEAFSDLLRYPTLFYLIPKRGPTPETRFSLKTPTEGQAASPPSCSYHVYHLKAVSLAWEDCDILLTVQRVPYKASKGAEYRVVIDHIFTFSNDYMNDKEKVLYELKQLATQQAPRSPP